MGLKLYNSLTNKKEKFVPIHDDRITIYVCGMTVYDVMHIGHARTYSSWDILVRYLKYRYPNHRVLHVQNYTDVGHLTDDADDGEDKVVKRARARKQEPMELVDYYIRYCENVSNELNYLKPTIMPRATGHIMEMIEFVDQLLKKGNAYETDRGIYFDVSTYDKYTELANLKIEEQKSGARIEVDELKRNPHDFALFIKAPESHIMKWQTPWGWLGYPGWHIECSAMSRKYLGDTIDIHTGGIDHLPIHHTNERAQTESLTGKPFANFWVHANFMNIDGEKMSKSKGNYISAQEGIDRFGKDLFRYYLATASHYRTLDDFTIVKFEQKRDEFEKLLTSMAIIQSLIKVKSGKPANEYSKEAVAFENKFKTAMDDDLNTPEAMAVIFNFQNYLNSLVKKSAKDEASLSLLSKDFELFLRLAEILSISPIPEKDIDSLFTDLLQLRQEAREKKDYETGDKIRKMILDQGFKVEDKPWGSFVIRLPKRNS